MGKGDKRTRRGKIVAGTFGASRPKARKQKVEKKVPAGRPGVKKKPAPKK